MTTSTTEETAVAAATMFMPAPQAMVESALRAGCQLFCAYPITPVEDMTEYWLKRVPDFPGALSFIPESELESGNMMYGFAAAGKRVAFASTRAGMSLIHEAMGMIMGAELPCVLFNFPRAGGLSISQADYNVATKAPSHGDEKMFVLAPMGTQEAVDLTREAFYLADKFRNAVMIMADYTLGLTMEVVEFKPLDESDLPEKDWALTGDRTREARRSLAMAASGGVTAANMATGVDETVGTISGPEKSAWRRHAKYQSFEPRAELTHLDDAEAAGVAYGTVARMILPVLERLREAGHRVGMIRPITLYPFPSDVINEASGRMRLGVIECNTGQMVDDVRLAAQSSAAVEFYGRPGGAAPSPDEIEGELLRLLSSANSSSEGTA